MNKSNSEYTIWYQGFGIDVGTKTFYNPDKTDYYEILCKIVVAVTDPTETDIVFLDKEKAEKFCKENSSEDTKYWFVEK
ncbi:hypothetical protein IMSAGC017_01944 [Thomasclavelia cocleata]|uniref:Uncharacterized protein n=1 Tax=Thomasclavelia cocleata TaxID=69824 RepID=A0A829ZEW8_9FIRM|nr:hypothetical protein [Thomasclavelia cocleata]GFI41898.1 hypothetical protein IMSAGC017_01944 [Thomasclavelia cocleata]